MKFKTNLIFQTLLIAVFFVGSINIIEAQRSTRHARTEITKICLLGTSLEPVDPIIPSICGEDFIQGTANSHFSEDGEVIISIYTVNLDSYLNPDNKGQVIYSLPEGADDIYLEYEQGEGEYSEIGPITEWEYFGTFQKDNGPIYPMYRGIVLAEFTSPTNESCADLNPDPTMPTAYAYEFNMNVKLIKSDGELYPIEDFAGENDIFSCKVFKENEFECSESSSQGERPVYDLGVCIPCPGLGDLAFGGERKNGVASYSLALSPNPFSDYVQYQYHSELETEAVVSILSTNGQILSQERKSLGIGKNTYLLDTNQLSQGVYFLQITDGEHREIQRMVKVN